MVKLVKYLEKQWMERLLELTKDYDPVDIWNMDEMGCFFKALSEKGLAEKKSQARGGKKNLKQDRQLLFSSVLQERKLFVIWRSVKPRFFKNLINPKRPYDVHYYLSKKSWMTSKIMDSVLTKTNRNVAAAKRNILLFMANAPCHPENVVVSHSNIKVVFYLKTPRQDSNL